MSWCQFIFEFTKTGEATCIMLVEHRKREAINFCERIKPGRWEDRDPDESYVR